MPKIIKNYVRFVEAINRTVGKAAMYLIFMMMGILLFSVISRGVFNVPHIWVVEMAQFTMAAYYIVGGAYSMQMNDHVRMDLVYDRCTDRNKARIDCFTNFFLVFYLACLLFGSISSTIYAIETGQRKFSMWNPSMIPIKIIMVGGITLMLLQAISTWIKDIARARDIELPGIDLRIARGADAVEDAERDAAADEIAEVLGDELDTSIRDPGSGGDTSAQKKDRT